MAATISAKYQKNTDASIVDVTISVDVVSFRPYNEARSSLEEHVYLRVSGGTGTTAWMRDITTLVADGLYGQQYGIDPGSNFTDTYLNGLDKDGVEGIITQLQKLVAPTYVDATDLGTGNALVTFVASASSDTLIDGYYFWFSADGITWTRKQALGGGIDKDLLGDATIGGRAKKTYTINSGTGAKYFGVTAVSDTTASDSFNESVRGVSLNTITIT
jgi:hypothetical protein